MTVVDTETHEDVPDIPTVTEVEYMNESTAQPSLADQPKNKFKLTTIGELERQLDFGSHQQLVKDAAHIDVSYLQSRSLCPEEEVFDEDDTTWEWHRLMTELTAEIQSHPARPTLTL